MNIDLTEAGGGGISRIRHRSIADTSIISKTARNVQKTVVTMPPSKQDVPVDKVTGLPMNTYKFPLRNPIDHGNQISTLLVPSMRSYTSLDAKTYNTGHPLHKMGPELKIFPYQNSG